MVDDGATIEDVKYSSNDPIEQRYQKASREEISQLGANPLRNIDLARAEAANVAYANQNKGKKGVANIFQLKKLLIQYVKKYQNKWDAMLTYPKQIKQRPAWFDLALSKFSESEITSADKKVIKAAFNQLWDYRDRIEPTRVMSEEESVRQYGINSPYYQPPESQFEGQISDISAEAGEMDVLPETPQVYPESTFSEQPIVQQPDTENVFGVRKVTPSENYLSGYMSPVRSTFSDLIPKWKPSVEKPTPEPVIQQNITIGQKEKISSDTGTGKGAFGIGSSMLRGISGGSALQGIMSPSKPSLPTQQVQVKPEETITVAQQPQVMQRKKKVSGSMVDRRTNEVSVQLKKLRSLELPSFSKSNVSKNLSVKKPSSNNIGTSTFKISPIDLRIKYGNKSGMKSTSIKSTFDISPINLHNKKSKTGKTSMRLDKQTVGNMSRDIRGSIGGVVGGIKNLKKQVRGEFRDSDAIKSINLKNIKANKYKNHKDLGVLEKLKSETRSQVSREALECKMIPKLKSQCDKVFTKNHITNEVSKFRNEFKDIHKMVPTVRGEKAKLNEVSMLGNSINHGVDGVHVDEIRSMYKSSGTTKQMNIGKMDYDYSFVTGKKKIKIPEVEEEYYEVE